MPIKRRRTGVTIPEDILHEVDEYIKLARIKSRSKLISSALKQFINERKLLLRKGRKVIGALLITYNEKRGDTVRKLLDIQHEFLGEIRATLHVHLTRDKCLEVILVEGKVSDVLQLLEGIENILGVEVARFIPAEIIEGDKEEHQ
ncbi:MAG: CopG family ribbon-helix-helix protein [Candidatus Njordarchaeales archaeon]